MFQINEQNIKQEIDESDLLEDICILDDVLVKQEHQDILDIKEENRTDIDDVIEKKVVNYQNENLHIKKEHLEYNKPLSEIEFVNVSDFNESKSENNNFNDINLKNYSEKKVYVFKCVQCKYETFRTLYPRQLIFTSIHSDRCDRCILIYKHDLNLSDERPFECNQCQYSFVTKGCLKEHQTKHTGKRHFKCNQCDYSATTTSRIKKHKLIHVNKVNKYSYTCNKCEYSTSEKRCLKLHNKHKHTTYYCDRCAYSARSKNIILTHRSKFNCKDRTGRNVRKCIYIRRQGNRPFKYPE